MKIAWIYDDDGDRKLALERAFDELDGWIYISRSDITFDYDQQSVILPDGNVNLILLHLRAPGNNGNGNQYSWDFLTKVCRMKHASEICLFAYTGGVEQQKPEQFPDFQWWRYYQSVQGPENIGANGLRAFLENWV